MLVAAVDLKRRCSVRAPSAASGLSINWNCSQPLAAKKQQSIMVMMSPACPVLCDGERLREVIDNLLQVKDNQPSLLRRLEDIAATTAPVAIDDSRNLAQIARKTAASRYPPGSALDETEWASLIAAVVRVERNTLIRSAATGQWTMRRETAFYASSVVLPAERSPPPSAITRRSKTRTTGARCHPRRGRQPHPRQPGHHGATAQSDAQHRPRKRRNKYRRGLMRHRSRPRHQPLIQRPVTSVEQRCRRYPAQINNKEKPR